MPSLLGLKKKYNNTIIQQKQLHRFLPILLAPGFLSGAVSLRISDVQQELVGTSSDETGSGSTANYSGSAAVGDSAVFDVADINNQDFADLRVTYSSDDGGVGSNIMIARTSDSQGLTDDGTLSILLDIGNSGGGTISLDFEWYTPGSFSGGVEQSGASLLSNPVNYTTFDIDFKQLVEIPDVGISQYTLDGSSVLTDTTVPGGFRFEDNGADSTFDDPTTAVGFLTDNTPQFHTITMGNQAEGGPALFMFEFRDPSDNVTFADPDVTNVPESRFSAILVAFGALGFALRRRWSGK